MTKIIEILDQTSGTGSKGVWIRTRIKTDDGKFANTFDSVVIGDEVTLEYNEQYKNYNAKKVKTESLAVYSPVTANDSEILNYLKNIERNQEVLVGMIKQLLDGPDTDEPPEDY